LSIQQRNQHLPRQISMLVSPQAQKLQLDYVRSHFPSLQNDWIFMDNAGGSQIARPVLERIQDYLVNSNVQLGASYAVSQEASDRVRQGDKAAALLMNAADPSEVVMGASTSLLLRILAICLSQTWEAGDEVIVTDCDHEANITPWLELQQKGIVVKFWRINPETLTFHLEDLAPLMTDKTRLVALTHASNVLGTINPIRAIAQFVHDHGALMCVDGVGYAPHRLINVQALDVDFYVYSFYKVYGPHHAVLYGKRDHLLKMPGFNHDFIPQDMIPYKFQPGGANYELSYSITGLTHYFESLARHHMGDRLGYDPRAQLEQAFELIAVYEEQLSDRLLSYLTSKPKVRIIGNPKGDRHQRVPTIAFVKDGTDSASIPAQLDSHHIGIRYGDFYAKRLINSLHLQPCNGVVRVSMVHYNTLEEVDRLIEQLEPLL
ncbi:MAG: cysteine desulfurase-like protein, partial [Leptolyngbyaceae bacterium]|nr:cysteine desulfurase-like protein [Leptolyngbyaceae bacterium]